MDLFSAAADQVVIKGRTGQREEEEEKNGRREGKRINYRKDRDIRGRAVGKDGLKMGHSEERSNQREAGRGMREE